MTIKTLRLYNFRNFTSNHEIIFPAEPLLVAAAPNATGKTNFLESLYVLLRGKSFRAPLSDCVQWEQDSFRVEGRVSRGGGDAYLGVTYNSRERRLSIKEDEVPVSPVTFYSHYPFILFLPEDTFMFTRGPVSRRNFLNTVLVSSPAYVSALVQYNRVLKQRNAVLRQVTDRSHIEAWTNLLVEYATTIWNNRRSLVQFLQAHVKDLYKNFTGEDMSFVVSLMYGVNDVEKYRAILDEAFPQETKYHYTLYGPHRDDLEVTINGRPAKVVLSRGQLKALVLALKVAGYLYMKQMTNQEPLLLFDEVLSELDEARQRAVLQYLPQAQLLLTCTHLPAQLKRRNDVFMLDLNTILQAPAQAQTRAQVQTSAVKIPVV